VKSVFFVYSLNSWACLVAIGTVVLTYLAGSVDGGGAGGMGLIMLLVLAVALVIFGIVALIGGALFALGDHWFPGEWDVGAIRRRAWAVSVLAFVFSIVTGLVTAHFTGHLVEPPFMFGLVGSYAMLSFLLPVLRSARKR
jgi:hypothetical protein